jgi:biopolymer transport protein ExbD
MVFLLLIYFMSSASLVKSEADLGIRLPGMLAQAQAVELPDEQMIEIRENGRVILNDREYDSPDSQELPELVALLIRYRLSSEAAGNEPMVTIWADDNVTHQRTIDVMNACAQAGIKNVTFTALAD